MLVDEFVTNTHDLKMPLKVLEESNYDGELLSRINR